MEVVLHIRVRIADTYSLRLPTVKRQVAFFVPRQQERRESRESKSTDYG